MEDKMCRIFGFELEPLELGDQPCQIKFMLLDNSTPIGTISLPIDGNSGARLIAAKVDGAGFNKVEITVDNDTSSEIGFAIARVRYAIAADTSTKTSSGPEELIEEAIAEIKDLEDDIDLGKNGAKKLELAIEQLTKSVNEELWENPSQLSLEDGDEVFAGTKNAVKRLMDILVILEQYEATEEIEEIIDGIESIITDDILEASRLLAQAALNEAEVADGNSKLWDKAQEEMEDASLSIVNKEYDTAAQHYFKAWNFACESINT
jgi:hypothetical protein